MQVDGFLRESAKRRPDKHALVCGERRLTYRELDFESDRVAALLRRTGVERGDRVVICLENSVEAVVAIFAVLKVDAVFVVVNPTTKPQKLRYLLDNSRAAGLISDGRRLRALGALADGATSLRVIVTVDEGSPTEGTQVPVVSFFAEAAGEVMAPVRRGIDADLAALVYTSGSTGHPKGVMLTHLNIVTAATSITTYLENTDEDIILSALPLAFDYGLYQVLMAFKVGATVVLERSFTYPHVVMETAVRERVTGLPIVPTMVALLRQLDLRRYDLSALRYLTNTGAALPTPHVNELRLLLPHVKIYLMYGLTECKRVSYLPPDEVDQRPDSVGRGMPNEELYLVDEQGNRLQSGIGELVVRGSHVMKGYWELPEETDRVLRPGPLPGERVLHSGDIFRMDDEGYLYFVGRTDDIIKTRGEKVSPKEVENVLHGLDGIAQAVVMGVPDPVLGEALKAIVTLRDAADLSVNDIRRHCARHLEDFMVPKTVEVRASLPTTATGKVDKKSLYATLAD